MMGAKLKKAGYKVVNDYRYNFKTQRQLIAVVLDLFRL